MEKMVSVIMPTYNRAHLIEESIKSVLKQTYSNFELIIVDDNSTDNTQEIIEKYKESYSCIKYVRHKSNKGGAAARNTGISHSNGEYLAFLDSDDQWHESKLSKVVNLLNENQDISMVYSDFYSINEKTGNKKYNVCYSPKNQYYAILCENYIGTTSLVVLRKNIVDEIGGFKEGLPSCQDWDFYINILKNYKAKKINEALVYYLVHENSISGNLDRVIEGHKYINKKVIDINPKYNINRINSAHYTTMARLYRSFSNFEYAKKYYIKSLKYYPLNNKALKNIIFCILGEEIYYKLLKIK